MEKLILLSEVFSVSTDYIIKGEKEIPLPMEKDTPKKRKSPLKKGRKILIIFLSVIVILSLSLVIFIGTRPVEFDAGACGGGYKAYIFDKYSQELLNEHTPFLLIDNVISFKIANENYEVNWIDNHIFIYFDIEYESRTEGTVIQRVSYTGTRIWTDTFRWKNAHLVGEE